MASSDGTQTLKTVRTKWSSSEATAFVTCDSRRGNTAHVPTGPESHVSPEGTPTVLRAGCCNAPPNVVR